MLKFFIGIGAFWMIASFGNTYASDQNPFVENSWGESVVDKAIAIVSAISFEARLPDISVFLKRIARTESSFGLDLRAYRQGYYGGIWQVDRIGFNETKNIRSHPSLRRIHAAVQRAFVLPNGHHVDWEKTGWEKCRIPVYSCLAARLYLATIAVPVPVSLMEQAAYWKKYYNTAAGSGRTEDFIAANS